MVRRFQFILFLMCMSFGVNIAAAQDATTPPTEYAVDNDIINDLLNGSIADVATTPSPVESVDAERQIDGIACNSIKKFFENPKASQYKDMTLTGKEAAQEEKQFDTEIFGLCGSKIPSALGNIIAEAETEYDSATAAEYFEITLRAILKFLKENGKEVNAETGQKFDDVFDKIIEARDVGSLDDLITYLYVALIEFVDQYELEFCDNLKDFAVIATNELILYHKQPKSNDCS